MHKDRAEERGMGEVEPGQMGWARNDRARVEVGNGSVDAEATAS